MTILTKIGTSYKVTTEYEDTHGGLFLMVLDANDFINANTGNCVTIDTGRHCTFLSKPIDFESL